MSTISPSSYQAVCSAAQASRNSSAASAAASSVNLRGGATSVEAGESDEGEEPGDVQIEPVRQHELEADQDGGGERRELQDRLPAGHEREQHRARGDEHLQDLLDDVEVGHPAARYWPQPQIENGDSRSSWKPKVRSAKTRAACNGSGSSRRTRKAASVAPANPSTKRRVGSRQPSG